MANKTKKINDNAEACWHVQDEKGGVFGPVDLHTLKMWVEDGRVSPLSQLSNDEQKSWVLAVSFADLEMDCVAEIEPGSFYGPIHAQAMAGLIADGSIPAAANIYQRGVSDESSASAASLRSEIDTLHKKFEEQRELMAQQDLRHAAELKAKESACALSMDNIALDHETEVNLIRQEAAEIRASMQKEISALQDEIQSIRKQNDLILSQKNAINLRVKELEREYEGSQTENLLHIKSKEIQIEEVIAEREKLGSEIKSLKARCEQLKAELIGVEQQAADEKINQSAERKLMILEQLFVEAANLLQDGEVDALDECEHSIVAENLANADAPELLDFEEIDPHERPVTEIYSAEEGVEPVITPAQSRSNRRLNATLNSESETRKSAKNKRRWPFGGNKKNLDHSSLAELEAQAHIELRRLSAEGGNISALFNKNK